MGPAEGPQGAPTPTATRRQPWLRPAPGGGSGSAASRQFCPTVSGLAPPWGYHSTCSVSPAEPQRDAVRAPTACVRAACVAPGSLTLT